MDPHALSEFELIRRFFDRAPNRALLGVGDDCALVRPNAGLELAITTDMLVEGRHFLPNVAPRSLGHKSLAVNLSDLAAMGAAPRWALLALGLPRAEPKWLEEFSAGFFALAERYGVELIGGDTTRSSLVTISIVALGEVPAGVAMYRSAAQPGDDIWVSGELGGAALALKRPEIEEAARRLHEPEPRVELGERLRGLAHAAIDVSDGLTGDLGHILERSQVGAVIDYERIPRLPALRAMAETEGELVRDCVLSGGDDYELVFTAAPQQREAIEALGAELGLPLSRIGVIAPGDAKLVVRGADGEPMQYRRSYDHFRESK
ncbi:MAG TPA: thiamine-phosphate kinase [Burkholderiales bacterium]|nr:thiamine-phosphate kinase [Burkholderiales bacterium]